MVRVEHNVLSFQYVVLHFNFNLNFWWLGADCLCFRWFGVVCNEDRDCLSGCAFFPYRHMRAGVHQYFIYLALLLLLLLIVVLALVEKVGRYRKYESNLGSMLNVSKQRVEEARQSCCNNEWLNGDAVHMVMLSTCW